MRVLMVSWEYPPLLVGGLGRHVEALAGALVMAGHEVCVVVRGESAHPSDDLVDGVRVVRGVRDPLAIDFTTESLLAWAQAAEHSMVRAALPIVAGWRPDVVHAHDWLVAQSAVTLARTVDRPLVATLHATEAGRGQGWLPEPLNRAIHSVERWLAQSADAVITCSSAMREEVARLFELPAAQIAAVPNGIDAGRWTVPPARRVAARAGLAPGVPMIAFAGRLVHEKGLHTLLSALPELRTAYPGVRLVVAGTGGEEAALRAQARRLGVARSVHWLGFVAEDELPAVLAAADVAVVPSLYEPFGIVALEAAVTATPLVLARVGGLRDLVSNGVAAASFPAGNVAALASAVGKVLVDPVAARRAAGGAARIVRREYTWRAVADRTVSVYRVAQAATPPAAGRDCAS